MRTDPRLDGGTPPQDLKRPSFVLVTGNRGKLQEARRLLGWDVEAVEMDLPEVQSLDLLEVLGAKADEAWSRLQRPLVVEETGLALDALNGFPGPLVKWMLEAVGATGIARVAVALGDPGVVARCVLCYRTREGAVVGTGETRGRLVLPPRGDGGFGWDPVFLPAGQTRTYGELEAAQKDALGHRGQAWRDLGRRLGWFGRPPVTSSGPNATAG